MNKFKLAAFLIGMLFITSAFAQDKDIKEVKFKADVKCATCKAKIEKHMSFAKGVQSVNADIASKTVTIGYKTAKTDETKLQEELKKVGYGAELIKCAGHEDGKKCQGHKEGAKAAHDCKSHKEGAKNECKGHKEGTKAAHDCKSHKEGEKKCCDKTKAKECCPKKTMKKKEATDKE